MQNTLLTTKLYFPPPRPLFVSRPRLVERLQSGLRGQLTLLSAPAGSGKTTLLSEWRTGPGVGYPVAWISLAPDDNDLTRFLQYLSAALENLQIGLVKEVQPLLQETDVANFEAVLTCLINHLSDLKRESILVLDDYHMIELPVIHQALTFLIDHLPPSLHLVLLTRSDPALPLARLRVRGQLTEIRAEHLCFNMDECVRFINQVMGLNLNDEQVAALEKRTEGWIAGLQLAAISLQGREDIAGFVSAFTGSNRYIVDYLAEEVLARQPEPVREFLLKTSILEQLTGPLCDALTGKSNGRTILAELDHANLFIIPLDHERCWYRFHHLFADLLHNHLIHTDPESKSRLHVQASIWLEENGYLDQAIHHALEARDFKRSARLFCHDHLAIMYNYSISTLDKWIRIFPETFLRANPWLCIAKAHILWTTGRRSELLSYTISSEESLAHLVLINQMSKTDQDYCILQGEALTFRSLIAMQENDLAAALAPAQKAVEIIPQNERSRIFALGSLCMIYQLSGDIQRATETCSEIISAGRVLNYPSMLTTATYTLAQLQRVQGRLRQAAQTLRKALEYAEHHGQARLFYCGILHLGLAETLYEWNALDEMESETEAGLALSWLGGMSILVAVGLLARALLKSGRGDFPGALSELEEIERACENMNPATYRDTCRVLRLRWQAAQGDLTGLAEWVSQVDFVVGEKISSHQYSQIHQAAQFLYLLDRGKEVLPVLEKMEAILQASGDAGWLMAVLSVQAIIWKRTGNEPRALACLIQLLTLAEPEGCVRIFLDLGEPMRELLHQVHERGGGSEFTTRLLAAFEPHPPAKAVSYSTKKPDVLSMREMELLRLISAGRSNKEIASQLVITVGTVKRHTVNIFTKLDVNNRTEAAAKARKLGLL